MNQMEIEAAYDARHACPNVTKGVRLLYRLMRAVNRSSDGWPYWAAPSRSAEKLMKLLKTAGYLPHGTRGTITDAQLKEAITPIRTMATVQKKKQAEYGNTFEFDVDAALAE
jgi:hypothetical protein